MLKRTKKWAKHPPAVTLVAWGIVVLFLIGLFQVFEPLVRMGVFPGALKDPLVVGRSLTQMGQLVAISALYLVLSLVGIIVLIGFMRLHRWAWVVLMVWTSVSLTAALINFFYNRPNYLVMVSYTIIAFALNQPEVQRIFRIRNDEGEHVR
jgi:hypothetical protein